MSYPQLVVGLAVDLVTIVVLAFGIYYRRYRRPEMLVAFTALNLGVFAAVTLLASSRGGMALGFGLFGILSIVRLRSSALSQSEVGYYFVALTLGLVNSLGYAHLPVAVALDAVLLVAMYLLDRIARVLDRPAVAAADSGFADCIVTLDVVHDDEQGLRDDLERRLGATVVECEVTEIDYVRDVTICSVRRRRAPARGNERAVASAGHPRRAR